MDRFDGGVPIMAGTASRARQGAELDGKSFRHRRDAADHPLPSS
jgi:hypothetical protein